MSSDLTTGRNVILITADSLRSDHVGFCTADASTRTPYLDEFASCSTVFTHAFAPGPYTAYSLPALFTGRQPCGLRPMRKTLPLWGLHGTTVEGTVTITELLRDAGYWTSAFHSNPLISRLSGFQKGFEVFYDDLWLGSSRLPANVRRAVAQAYRLFRTQPNMSARGLNQKAAAFLKTATVPFFLFIHYMDTHGPYLRRKILKGLSRSEQAWRLCGTKPADVTPRQHKILTRNYRRQVSYLDQELGALLRVLKSSGVLDRALLIISADHGEEFREHGGYSHTCKLYDELVHVPLIVRLPGQAMPRTIEQITETIQIAPTILDFAGISYEHFGFDAQSFLPLLRGEPILTKGFAYSEAGPGPHDCVSVRTEKWKLILKRPASSNGASRPAADRMTGLRSESGILSEPLAGYTAELYNLERDPREQCNLAAQLPNTVSDLKRHIEAHFSGADRNAAHMYVSPEDGNRTTSLASDAAPAADLSEAEQSLVEERLRDLGYL